MGAFVRCKFARWRRRPWGTGPPSRSGGATPSTPACRQRPSRATWRRGDPGAAGHSQQERARRLAGSAQRWRSGCSRRRDYRGSPVPVTGTDGALQLVGLTASALSPGSANLGNVTDATLRACGSGTRRGADPASGGRVCLPPQGSSWVFLAAVSHDTTVWCPWDCSSWSWSSLCSGDVVQLAGSEQGR